MYDNEKLIYCYINSDREISQIANVSKYIFNGEDLELIKNQKNFSNSKLSIEDTMAMMNIFNHMDQNYSQDEILVKMIKPAVYINLSDMYDQIDELSNFENF